MGCDWDELPVFDWDELSDFASLADIWYPTYGEELLGISQEQINRL